MLRALWFGLKAAILVAVAVWVARIPGSIELQWLGYDVRVHVGTALLFLLIAVLLMLSVYRMVLDVLNWRQKWRHYRAMKARDKGMKSLTLGLSAVASGNAKLASYHAYRTRKFIPGKGGLPLFLEAQSARLQGKDIEAAKAFKQLAKDKDTAFLGVRGLLVKALEDGDTAGALTLARSTQKTHSDQTWVTGLVYDLEIKCRQWQNALKALTQAVKKETMSAEEAQSDRIAIYVQIGDEALDAGDEKTAEKYFRMALKLDKGFVPAAERLILLLKSQGKRVKAVNLLQKTWSQNPHPVLSSIWSTLIPQKKKKPSGHILQWHEKLISLRPDSVLSQICAAQAAVEEGLWGQARQYLDAAEKIELSSALYECRADLAERTGQLGEATQWREKAHAAPPEIVWFCQESGHIYESWSALSEPEGHFNTMIWGYPQTRSAKKAGHQVQGRKRLSLLSPL